MIEKFNIAVIGGGAAGLMAAIAAAENGAKNIILLEGNKRCGTKILMSGGTRCNVTNVSVSADDFFGGSRNFIKNVLKGFDDKAAIDFFKRLGVTLKLEDTGKYFPEDDRASSVLWALVHRAEELKINIRMFSKVNKVSFSEGEFTLTAEKSAFKAEKVIITTGGKSYPSTGSDGSGYTIAAAFGHHINETFPALTPVLLNEPLLASISGVTIQARLMLFLNGKKHVEFEGSLLFTHFGISGPAVLNISREAARLKNEKPELLINFVPSYSYENMMLLLKETGKKNSDKTLSGFLKTLMPVSLAEVILKKAGILPDRRFNSISKDEMKMLVKTLTGCSLNFTGVKGFQQAEATAGGVRLEEIKYQTMESRLQGGLYFAGEILDVDGLLGGYNFQWAWSSGYIAGKSAAGK